MTVAAQTRTLESAGVGFELLPHDVAESTETVMLTTPAGYVRAVLPASERIDLRKVRDALEDGEHVHLASEEELARNVPELDLEELDLAAVPLFAGSRHEPVLLDRRLAEREWIVLEAGFRTESVRMRTGNLVWLTRAKVADICED